MSQYATVARAREQSPAYFDALSDDEVTTLLVSASSELDLYFGAVFTLPLTAYPDIVSEWCVNIAVYRSGKETGFALDGSRTRARVDYEDTIQAVKDLSKSGSSYGFTDSTPTVEEGGTYVVTNRKRGWR